MSGQSIADRITAAKHSLSGQALSKTVCKATTEEVMGPKKKHIDYLLQCTNEPNVSIPNLADQMIERTQHSNWVVVFKSLISIHNMMNYGNERFTQYLASNNCSFNLGNFLDKTGVQGYDMSTFIRRYAKYLNEKAVSYRLMAFDFCKVKRGKDDGLLRTMNGEKLLKTLPALQTQLDALLEFDASPNELTNGVINACFMLMFKDLIRLFACYNDGIINLLEKYFEMNKKQCKEALEIYKRFLVRMEKVSEFLKVAEQVGIDRGDIPDLAKAPSSLLDALEQHLQSLEGKKGGGPLPPKPVGVASAIKTLSANAPVSASPSSTMSTPTISDEEKKKILEEESRQLQQLKEKQQKQPSPSQSTSSTNPFATVTQAAESTAQVTPSPSADLFASELLISAPTSSSAATSSVDGRPSDDLLSLSGPSAFAHNIQNVLNINQAVHQMQQSAQASTFPTSNPWNQTTGFSNNPFLNGGPGVGPASQMPAPLMPTNAPSHNKQGFDAFGDVLKPQGGSEQAGNNSKIIQGDLDSSLASLAGNLNMNGAGYQVKKNELQWKTTEKKLTGGSNWQPGMGPAPAASWQAQPQQPVFQHPMVSQPVMMGYPSQRPVMPGMMGTGFTQPVAAMGHPHSMGMGQPAMFASMPQPGVSTAGSFHQPTQNNTNDPFGAL